MESVVRPRGRSRVGLAWLALLASVATACGAPARKAEAPRAASPPGDLASYFPLETNHVFSYVTHEPTGDGMLVARAERTAPDRGQLVITRTVRKFVYRPDGVAYDDGGAYILKAPIAVGTSWHGEHDGTTRITRIDKNVSVPAGSFAGCLETVEESGQHDGARYTITYCPGVGIVLLEVERGAGENARVELRSHGPAVDLR